jgi:predicted anti-sigma-YlaC factor YlaD
MADIIRLRGSPHEQTQELLPWYVNGTLEADEVALVDSHLAECGECRTDLELERALGQQVASLPVDAERGWAALADKLDTVPPPGAHSAPVALFRRKVALGWAAAGQLAAAALIVGLFVSQPSPPDQEIYHALGTSPGSAPGNVVVLFNPETSEKDIRASLLKLEARMIDGPTAGGAYVLHVAAAKRAHAIAALRGSDQILLAEPIDLETRR